MSTQRKITSAKSNPLLKSENEPSDDNLRRQQVKKTREHVKKKQAFHGELTSNEFERVSFSYISSNDLQEPLRKIQTFSSRILEKEIDNLSASGREYFARMQKAANRMQLIMNDLVVYTDLHKSTRQPEYTDVKVLLDDVCAEMDALIKEKNATIKLGRLGNVNVIPDQFRQLLSNLLRNSLKFSDPQKPLEISVSSRIVSGSRLRSTHFDPDSRYYHLKFKDNGIGFEPRFCDRIFEMFQRLHGQDRYEGTGIGLAICRKIVENHNGVISARGELQKGAIFDIYIPVDHE